MAKDYAKNRSSGSGSGNGRGNGGRGGGGAASRRGAPSKSSSGMPGWVWGLLGLSLGLFAAAWVWIDRPAKPSPLSPNGGLPAATATATGAGAAATTLAAGAKPGAGQAIELPPKQPSKYAFYEMLPSYEVVIPREDAAASAKTGKPTTPEIAAPGQYLIQVGAYKTRDEADRSRANLALLGVESKIEQVTIDQAETWYRVRIGPETSLTQAQDILQRLDDNGIKGMLVKVKEG